MRPDQVKGAWLCSFGFRGRTGAAGVVLNAENERGRARGGRADLFSAWAARLGAREPLPQPWQKTGRAVSALPPQISHLPSFPVIPISLLPDVTRLPLSLSRSHEHFNSNSSPDGFIMTLYVEIKLLLPKQHNILYTINNKYVYLYTFICKYIYDLFHLLVSVSM